MTDTPMPDEIFIDCTINAAGYFQVDKFSSKELTEIQEYPIHSSPRLVLRIFPHSPPVFYTL